MLLDVITNENVTSMSYTIEEEAIIRNRNLEISTGHKAIEVAATIHFQALSQNKSRGSGKVLIHIQEYTHIHDIYVYICHAYVYNYIHVSAFHLFVL